MTGSEGSLGSALMGVLGGEAAGVDLPRVDITNPDAVSRTVEEVDPEWIINCAAVTDVDLCQRDPKHAFSVNCDAVALLAGTGRKLLTISTDHVFGGGPPRSHPYVESDTASPVNVYGESKLLGEEAALQGSGDVIIARTSWLYSDRSGIVPYLWGALTGEGQVRAVIDQVSALTYVHDLVPVILELIEHERRGVFHAVSAPALTPFDAAVMLSEHSGGEVAGVTWKELKRDAPRPRYSFLSSERGVVLPDSGDALMRWRRCNA